MASFIFSIIPADQAYVPNIQVQHRAVDLLRRTCPESRECEARTYDELTWVHPHFNLIAILCPSCGARNEIDRMREDGSTDPISDWWERVEQEASVSPVEKMTVVMSCCGRIVLLPTLEFDWPGGFAHFELSI
jgi:hypothetical protein